jgi:hypothetical protein
MKGALLIAALGVIGASAEAAQPEAKPAGASAPQSIGRLFFTPAERAQLDTARLQRKPAAPTASAAAPVEPPPTTQIVTYSGIVRRSDGKSMLWINNRLVEEKDALSGLSLKGKVRSDGAVTLQVPQTGGSIDVKVGQSVELQTGRVAETRKPPPELRPAADDAKPSAAEPAATASTSPPPPTSVPGGKPAPETAEKKPASGPGVGLKMDLGGRTLEPAESQRLSGTAK